MNEIPERFHMNLGVMNLEDLDKLEKTTVTIVGVGGLGGNVANQLVRLGVTNLVLIDFDTFSESNLNRQLFSNTHNIGKRKVDVVKDELIKINPDIHIKTFFTKAQNVNIRSDYIIDCVDNAETKIFLSDMASQMNIPLLHGSCGGWYGQVGWISPQSTIVKDLYKAGVGLEKNLLNPPFAPSVVSSYMVSEFLKIIINQNVVMDNLLLIDLYNNTTSRTGG